MFSPTQRVIKFALQDFIRNFWLSLVTLTLLVLALLSINLLIIFNVLAGEAINSVEETIDITVYFKPAISEDQVLNVKGHINSLVEVSGVEYISKDEALELFREKHKDNEKIVASLDELDENPLGATLVIKSRSTEEYPKILAALENEQYAELIDDTDFGDHRTVISRITTITNRVNKGVIVIALIFVLISALIIFNTIRVAMHTHREEIRAMKLVGATNMFIRAPFLLESVLFSILALAITIAIVYPFLGFTQPFFKDIFGQGDFSIVTYFDDHFLSIFGWQLAGMILLGLISSTLAVGKYLRV